MPAARAREGNSPLDSEPELALTYEESPGEAGPQDEASHQDDQDHQPIGNAGDRRRGGRNPDDNQEPNDCQDSPSPPRSSQRPVQSEHAQDVIPVRGMRIPTIDTRRVSA